MTTNNIVMVVALFIAASWAWGSVTVMERNYTLQRELDAKKRELTLVELQTELLRYEQQYYKSDEYKDLSAREHLRLASPGEKVLILPHLLHWWIEPTYCPVISRSYLIVRL